MFDALAVYDENAEPYLLGSDFDGAIIPDFIANCAGLPKLTELMRENGFEDELIKKICSENWLKFLRKNF